MVIVYKLTVLAILISISMSDRAIAEERSMAIASLSSLVFANGESLASSRYSGLISPSEEKVLFSFSGVNEVYLDAELSIDTMKIKNDEEFALFLKESGVKPEYINKIVNKNKTDGFVHSTGCKGRRSDCIVETKSVDFSINYYDKVVRVFFSPEILLQNVGEDSYLNMNGDAGLINNISVYYDGGMNGTSSSYYLRDQGRSGFKSGYLTYNLYKSDYQSEVDDVYFTHAIFQKNKFSAGRMSSASDFNSSSSNSLFSGSALTGLRVGSASEYIDRSYGNRIFRYYSPSNGSIEVRRNGEVVYTTPTSAGYSDLNLDGLPSGNYTAELIVRSATGDIVSRQPVIINNVSNSVNEFAWHLFGGKSSDAYGYVPSEDKRVVEGGFQVPLMSNTAFFLGGGLVGSLDVASTGINYAGDILALTAKVGSGSDSLKYYEANIYLKGISLSYNKTTAKTEGQEGKRSDTSFTANYNTSLTDSFSMNSGYLYTSSQSPLMLTGIENRNDNEFFRNRDDKISRYSSRSIYGNIFYSVGDGVSIYAGVNKELSGSSYNVSLGFTIPLFSNNVNLSNSTYYTEGGNLSSTETVDYTQNLSESWSQKVSASTYLANDNYNSLGYMLSHNSRYLYGSGYYYHTDNGQKRFTLNGNSTQILSSNGLDFLSSSQTQSSFITIGDKVTYDVAIKDLTNNTTTYLDGTRRTIPVAPYHKLKITTSTEAGDYVLANGQTRESRTIAMVPGSATDVSTKATRVNSIIITTKNESGGYLSGATCADENCVSTGRLSSGVYRVKFTGSSTLIRTGNHSCKVEYVPGKRFYDVICK